LKDFKDMVLIVINVEEMVIGLMMIYVELLKYYIPINISNIF